MAFYAAWGIVAGLRPVTHCGEDATELRASRLRLAAPLRSRSRNDAAFKDSLTAGFHRSAPTAARLMKEGSNTSRISQVLLWWWDEDRLLLSKLLLSSSCTFYSTFFLQYSNSVIYHYLQNDYDYRYVCIYVVIYFNVNCIWIFLIDKHREGSA